MKRARIMLLAIAAFATVGTALAFKVKKFGDSQYCYKITTVQPAAGECKTGINLAQAVGSQVQLYYTITSDFTRCANAPQLACPSKATQFAN